MCCMRLRCYTRRQGVGCHILPYMTAGASGATQERGSVASGSRIPSAGLLCWSALFDFCHFLVAVRSLMEARGQRALKSACGEQRRRAAKRTLFAIDCQRAERLRFLSTESARNRTQSKPSLYNSSLPLSRGQELRTLDASRTFPTQCSFHRAGHPTPYSRLRPRHPTLELKPMLAGQAGLALWHRNAVN